MVRLVVLVGLAAVGFGAGRWLRANETEEVPAPTPEVELGAEARVPELQGDPCDHVPLVEALLARTREEIEGVPRPFPDDPALQPTEFRRLLEVAQRACPEMAVDHVDCDEYPCFAWVRDACTETGGPPLGTWTSSIDNVTLGDGSPARWKTLWLASPDEGIAGAPPHRSNEGVRLETRNRRARDAIEAKTGARSMTEVERWTASVKGAEELLKVEQDLNPEMRRMVEKNLVESRAELERAVEREGGE
jgi:hypothetical protein